MAGRNHLKFSGIIAWNVLNCREPFSVPLTDFSSDPDFYQVPITVLGHISRDTDRMTSKFQIMHSVMSLTARWHFHWIGIIGNNLYQVPICVQGHKYIGMIFFSISWLQYPCHTGACNCLYQVCKVNPCPVLRSNNVRSLRSFLCQVFKVPSWSISYSY